MEIFNGIMFVASALWVGWMIATTITSRRA